MPTISVHQAMLDYLDTVRLARSANTARSYHNALQAFAAMLNERAGSPTKGTKKPEEGGAGQDQPWTGRTDVQMLHEDAIAWFAQSLKDYTPATEQLYLTAAAGFFEYLASERLSEINLPRLKLLLKQRARKPGKRLPQFPRGQIEQVIDYAIGLTSGSGDAPGEAGPERLIRLRDRALILILADSGLRIHEACKLRRGDIDWNEGRAIIIGKGDQEAVVRFSRRSLAALKDYLHARARLDGASGRPLPSLPLFARHDRGAGKKVKPITTTTGRNIIDQRCKEALGDEDGGNITPHSFRHYFVTAVLRGSGGNLKMAQELARHKNIDVTQRYAHLSDDELDQGYSEIFD